MPSYEPVDLSAACNAGVGVLGDEQGGVPLGRVDLRGLPFLIGSQPSSAERCFLLPSAPTPVGIGRLARRVIIAHRLLEPGAPAVTLSGGPSQSTVFTLPAARSSPRPSGSGSKSRWCRRGGAVCRSSPSPTPATTTCRVSRADGAKPGLAWWSTTWDGPPVTTCGAGKIPIRNERSNGSSSSRAVRDS